MNFMNKPVPIKARPHILNQCQSWVNDKTSTYRGRSVNEIGRRYQELQALTWVISWRRGGLRERRRRTSLYMGLSGDSGD
jgi:hypothetical protein